MATNREKIKESIEKWKSIVDELLTEFINGEFFEWEIDEVHSYDSISRLFNDTKNDALDYLDDCIRDADLDNNTAGKAVSIFYALSDAISTINNLKAMLNYLPEEHLKAASDTLEEK